MEGWVAVWDHQLGAGAAGVVLLGMTATLVSKAKAADGINSMGYFALSFPCAVATLLFGIRSLVLLLQ